MLLKKPGFTLVAVFTLALGIGANTAIFSVVNGVLLRSLPYRDDERIVTLWQNNLKNGVEREETSPANFLDWREQSQAFETIAAAEPFGFTLLDYGEPETFRGWMVSAGFFDILGTAALHGRTFAAEEYRQGNHQVIVLGYGLWQRRFGGDTAVIGQQFTINGQPHTIVGVMPPEFQFPPDREIWAPRLPRERDPQIRAASYIKVVARLKPGLTLDEAQQDMNLVAARLSEQHPQTNENVGALVVGLREYLVGQIRPALLILFAAVLLVLLIACANIANLLMVRATERSREFAIRAALGAGPSRILRQMLTESLLLAFTGGLGGLLLAGWLVEAIIALSPGNLPRLNQVTLNTGVMIFAFGVSALTALVFGLLPALAFSRPDLQEALKEGSRAQTAGGKRKLFRNALVVAEVALALVLVVGAGLLVRSFIELIKVDPGFAAEKAIALEASVGRQPVAERSAFFDQATERVSQLAGVEAVGATSALPFHDNQILLPTTVAIEGRPVGATGDEPTAYRINVTGDYFRALGVEIIEGRSFNQFDRADSPQVAIINRTMRERHWPNESAIGKKISFETAVGKVTAEIVGIVEDLRPTGYDSQPRPELYSPYSQSAIHLMTFLVRTTSEPEGLIAAVKEKIREVNKAQTFNSTYTLDQLVDKSIAQRRFNLLLLAGLAGLALVLAGVGLYGLLSYATAQRTHEIGVRMALGARPRDVLRMIVWDGFKLALIGAGAGVVAALLVTRLMSSLLFNVSATDGATYMAITLLLIAIALAACYIPARRATKVDPMVALRYE
jgi:putative ABC transport system permease protein